SDVVAYVVDEFAPEGITDEMIEDALSRGVGINELALFVQLQETIELGEVLTLCTAYAFLHAGIDHARCQRGDPRVRVLLAEDAGVVINRRLGGAIDT